MRIIRNGIFRFSYDLHLISVIIQEDGSCSILEFGHRYLIVSFFVLEVIIRTSGNCCNSGYNAE